jgi:hypothetical protein
MTDSVPHTTELILIRLRVRRSDVVNAAKRFDACMSEFEGDMSCCQEHMDGLFDACQKLNREEDEIGFQT